MNHEYVLSCGDPPFTKACVEFLLGKNSPAILEGRAQGIQTISGSGALFMGAQFLCQVLDFKTVYLSNPTWGKIIIDFLNIFKKDEKNVKIVSTNQNCNFSHR